MKRFILLALACLYIVTVYGADFVSPMYSRNSLSVVLLTRGDQYDSQVEQVVKAEGIPEKFDVNDITTKQMRVYSSRSQAVSTDDVTSMVASHRIARQILEYEFSRREDGTMSDELILGRGNYNATDQDYVNAMATKVGKAGLSETGYALISSSYVICLDFYRIYSETRSGTREITWYVDVAAHVYRLDIDDEALDYIYNQCWIYDDDSEQVRQAKRSAFDGYNFTMNYVTTAMATVAESELTEAVVKAYSKVYSGMEELVSTWRVATTIQTKRPLSAKIGTKESLRNGDRYRAYSYRQNKEGDIVSVRHGYLRATEVADNSNDATGNMAMSKFYQISGVQDIQPGWAIKQSHDAKLGVGINYSMGGLSKSALNLDLDYMVNIGRKGCIWYILAGAGIDISSLSSGVGTYRFNLGAGYGIPFFTRQVELMPYATFGLDKFMGVSLSSSSSSKNSRQAFYAEGGGRLMVTIWYPVQVYAKVGYDLLFLDSSLYSTINNTLSEDLRHKSGLAFDIGIRIAL